MIWERIRDPQDHRRTIWWRGTEDGRAPAYCSVALRDGLYEWAVRARPGVGNEVTSGYRADLAAARLAAERAWSQWLAGSRPPARRRVRRCEAQTSKGACDLPLDAHGYCGRPSDHINPV